VLRRAWGQVKRNRGAAGIDGETLEAIEAYGVERMLAELRELLVAGRYRPQAVRRVYIPKPGSRVDRRPLASLGCGIEWCRRRRSWCSSRSSKPTFASARTAFVPGGMHTRRWRASTPEYTKWRRGWCVVSPHSGRSGGVCRRR
jgi:hypothetical protein